MHAILFKEIFMLGKRGVTSDREGKGRNGLRLRHQQSRRRSFSPVERSCRGGGVPSRVPDKGEGLGTVGLL